MRGRALSCVAIREYLQAPDALECSAAAVSDQGAHGDAARLLAGGHSDLGPCWDGALPQLTRPGSAVCSPNCEKLPPSEFDGDVGRGRSADS